MARSRTVKGVLAKGSPVELHCLVPLPGSQMVSGLMVLGKQAEEHVCLGSFGIKAHRWQELAAWVGAGVKLLVSIALFLSISKSK